MTTLLPTGARMSSLRDKLRELATDVPRESWFAAATRNLRGGDGGEHGLLLYGLVRRLAPEPSGAILDVGTARGFSAVTMARAVHDGGLRHRIYSVDVIAHDDPRDWHRSRKHDPSEPLAGLHISRSEIWSRWYSNESDCIEPLCSKSHDVLESWDYGPIVMAFVDGAHTYDAVKNDLVLLDNLMAKEGTIVLDDFHTGMLLGGFQSRLLNGAVRRIGSVARRWVPRQRTLQLGTHNEFLIVNRRFSGVYRAVAEFVSEREDTWSMEIVSMPSRGDYHAADYSLALLTKNATDARSSAPALAR